MMMMVIGGGINLESREAGIMGRRAFERRGNAAETASVGKNVAGQRPSHIPPLYNSQSRRLASSIANSPFLQNALELTISTLSCSCRHHANLASTATSAPA